MTQFIVSAKEFARSKAFRFLFILAIVAAIPLTVLVSQQQQEIRQRAQEAAPTPVELQLTVTPTPIGSVILGDINGDDRVDIADYSIFASCFGTKANTPSCGTNKTAADINKDGEVDGVDYNLFLRSLNAIAPIPTKISSPHSISIIGDNYCVSRTNESLELLRNKAPTHYDTVVKYIGIVECAQSGTGVYVYENPPRALVGKAILDAGTIWHAGGLAHEACHSQQYNDYRLNNPNVPIDVYSGRDSEAQCLDIQYDALSKIGASQSDLDYIKNVINTDYWDIPYENRWW